MLKLSKSSSITCDTQAANSILPDLVQIGNVLPFFFCGNKRSSILTCSDIFESVLDRRRVS